MSNASAAVCAKHRKDAETVVDEIGGGAEAVDLVAQALAVAEQHGIQRALRRLGPRIANLYTATIDMAGEVGL